MHQGSEVISYCTVEDWYIRYSGINKSDFCHLGAIVEASNLSWYKWFKRNNFGRIVNISNFAVVYTPTSVEVGEGITAKFACVDFHSSKVGHSCVPTSQLIVALCLYSVLLVLTVFRYGRYISFGTVA